LSATATLAVGAGISGEVSAHEGGFDRGARAGAMTETDLGARDSLVIVDVQRDFCPGGTLAVPQGDEIIAPLNAWIVQAEHGGAVIVASRDWHPRGHPSFKTEGGPWPEHCVQDTPGAAFCSGLRLPVKALLICKGVRLDRDQYSAFDETGLAAALRKRGVERVWITGLALDVCVRATALDAVKAGFETHVVLRLCRALSLASEREALDEMRKAGVNIDGEPVHPLAELE
jgi:nicotinamidase/pyrazinamidase